MTALSDGAIGRLKTAGAWPEFVTDRYRLSEEIGRGGMGTVYLALDRDLGREVAIKVPHVAASATFERRLGTEAQVLARLEHPGIVPIHDMGRLADGRLFYVMKRVRGRTLRDHVGGLPDLTERLRVFERVCEPVAFAHAHGCIHRDLKPENVMIGAYGEVMVMDWGVARITGDHERAAGSVAAVPGNATHPGTIVGTPGFMAPEQARAAASIDFRADVYSLGAILYMLLTGDDPAGQQDAAAAIQRHRNVPRPLRSICARALAAAPEARYQTVGELADDVSRYRAGYAVAAHKESVAEATVRLARTYRVAILLVLAYVIMRALVAFTIGR